MDKFFSYPLLFLQFPVNLSDFSMDSLELDSQKDDISALPNDLLGELDGQMSRYSQFKLIFLSFINSSS